MPRGEFQGTELNRLAGDYLLRARKSLGKSQPEFAEEIAATAGVTGVTGLSGWERNERTVPAAVVLAALRLSGLPLVDPVAERQLSQRLQKLEEGLEEVQRELRQRRDTRLLGAP